MTGPPAADLRPSTFGWLVEGKVAVITLSRPERKNPLTFASYAELRDTFRALARLRGMEARAPERVAEAFVLSKAILG